MNLETVTTDLKILYLLVQQKSEWLRTKVHQEKTLVGYVGSCKPQYKLLNLNIMVDI